MWNFQAYLKFPTKNRSFKCHARFCCDGKTIFIFSFFLSALETDTVKLSLLCEPVNHTKVRPGFCSQTSSAEIKANFHFSPETRKPQKILRLSNRLPSRKARYRKESFFSFPVSFKFPLNSTSGQRFLFDYYPIFTRVEYSAETSNYRRIIARYFSREILPAQKSYQAKTFSQ